MILILCWLLVWQRSIFMISTSGIYALRGVRLKSKKMLCFVYLFLYPWHLWCVLMNWSNFITIKLTLLCKCLDKLKKFKFSSNTINSTMGNRSSLLLREEEIAQIQEETGCKLNKLYYLPPLKIWLLYLLLVNVSRTFSKKKKNLFFCLQISISSIKVLLCCKFTFGIPLTRCPSHKPSKS